MRNYISIIITLFSLHFAFGFGPIGCTYDVSTNVLTIHFDDQIKTGNVLVGLLNVNDGSSSLQLSGGDVDTTIPLSDIINISLVYGTIVDSRGSFLYWGKTNSLPTALEEMDIENLELTIGVGAFINSSNQINLASTLPVEITNNINAHPAITGVDYDSGENLLTFHFDRTVRFDQIAEDRSCNLGTGNCPGNGILDGGPSEDVNGNGVLEMESNINPFKIQFFSSENEMTLEGFRSVVQTVNASDISLYPTISDSKKLELNIIETTDSPVSVIINKSAFVDLNYNPNITDTLILNIQPDPTPLVLSDATYDLGQNEFRFYFANSRDVEIFNPFPVYSKIRVTSGENMVSLSGVIQKSFSGNTLILTELLYSDQKAVEGLILNASSTINVELDPYAIYDIKGNGNAEGSHTLTVIGAYNNPALYSASYDGESNRIILNWAPHTIAFYETTRLFETINNIDITGIFLSNVSTGEALTIASAKVSRDFTKQITYLEVSEENSGWLEISGTNGDQLIISIAPYKFYTSGNSDNNGNLNVSDILVNYVSDAHGPALHSIKIDFYAKQLLIGFDKNVQTDLSTLNSITLILNSSELTLTDLTLLNTETTTNELTYQISDVQFSLLTEAVPSNEIFDVNIILPDGVFNNVDNIPGLGCQDLNNNGMCDTTPEPFLDYGVDNIISSDEHGYPGSCAPEGGCSDPSLLTQSECQAMVCSDPQYTNQSDCLAPGSCSRPNRPTREACINGIPPGIWYSDNTWSVAGVWTDYSTETLCDNAGANWTPNLDPNGDNYDSVTNPLGTEGNGLYDFGESFTDFYPNGIWDSVEPTTIRTSYGKFMWNQSFRAFADPQTQMFFVHPFQNSDLDVFVEESVWNGRCHDDDIISAASCTKTGTQYINGRCVFTDVDDETSCLAIPGTGTWKANWTKVTSENVMDVAEFYLAHKDELTSKYGTTNGNFSIVLYDISDEFGKGSNDTNSSLFTHGYFSINETEDVGLNEGDILYLDIFPQKIYNDSAAIPDKSTMYNALIHEFTKMLITTNEPEEEVWLKEGLAYFEQKRVLGETKFFGNGTNPGTPAANQLTYISFSKKNRSDQHNVFLFLNYLFEKYSGSTGWEIIDELATNGFQGIEAVDQALVAMDPGNPTTKEVFLDYATACFLDVPNSLGVYNGKYNMDNVDLYGAPSSKNAAALKFEGNKPPPYTIREIPPWSFGFYLIEGFSVSLLDNSVAFKSALLQPNDDLVFDGYNGIDFKVNKIMLKNGFTENMDPLYEVAEFEMDPENGRGILPVSTTTIPDVNFEFKYVDGNCTDGVSTTQSECCTENGGIWSGSVCDGSTAAWVWSGNKNIVLIVAKVDDTQPPASYDCVVTNITTPQDFSDFYVLQNHGIYNFLDLYVTSQRPIYDEFGIEGPKIQIASEFDTTYVLLGSVTSPSSDLILYYSPFALGGWPNYTLTYAGMDQSGNPVDGDVVHVTTTYTTSSMGKTISSSNHDVGLTIYDSESTNSQFIYIENSALIHQPGFIFDTPGISPMTPVSYFGPGGYTPINPVKIAFDLGDLEQNSVKIYHMTPDGWSNIGGTVSDGQIRTYADHLGYFLLASGENHPPEQTLNSIPDHIGLDQNYPNPFNPITTIGFSIPNDQYVVLTIFNLNGQHIRTIAEGYYTAGEYSVMWDGLTKGGIMAPTGVYFARLSTDNYTQMIKMVLMK